MGHYWDLFSKKIVGPLLVLGKGPIKWGLSVLPSVLLSLHFLGIVSIVFSEFWQGARNPYEVVYDRARFFIKTLLPQKLGKWVTK